MDASTGLSTRADSTISELLPQFDFSKFNVPHNESGPIDMSVGENAVLADEIVQLSRHAVQSGLGTEHLTYPKSPVGDPELLKALASFINAYFRPVQTVEWSHVAVAAGASACLDNLMYSLCDPGDAVLVPGPYWSEYRKKEKRIYIKKKEL
jgi:aspartate/methionine/tyrosine aminotransferase